ncbi:hypothetical protein, partial [Streptomyces beigongshangae]|uniref:hypothetical protein n=1 Tax=Streptomyces beigongshangae TaxID=2841597 RepID=UPI001C858B46
TLPSYSPSRAFLRALPFVFPTLPDPFSVPFPVRNSYQVAGWGAFAYLIALRLSFGESDFIRGFRPVRPADQF